MKTMKYVLNSNTNHFLLIPDIGMQHSAVDRVEEWTNAGFVKFDTSKKDEYGCLVIYPVCFGKSVSLKLESGPNDAEIIHKGMRDDY